MKLLDQLARIAELEFATILTGTQAIEPKRRFFLADGSFVDVWASVKLPGRFGSHWERRHVDGTVYRYDNFPDPAWHSVATFPHHFHDGSETNVVASPFPTDLLEGFRTFLAFVGSRLQTSKGT